MTITPIQNYTDKELNFNFSSPENDYTFNFLDIIEPNNGRLLREIKVTFKGADITEDLYGSWHYTDMIEPYNYEFSSSDGGHLFFPSENSFIVYNTKTNSKATFQKNHSIGINYFDKNFLLIIGPKRLTVIDLVNYKSEEIVTDFLLDFAFFKESSLFLISLQNGLYSYNKTTKSFDLKDIIFQPETIFPNDYYKEYENVSKDQNRGFTFALGVKALNNTTTQYNINSWKFVSRRSNHQLIIGTNVPNNTEKVKDPYSYTHWFYGNVRHATLDY
jgi:hypothetical protein